MSRNCHPANAPPASINSAIHLNLPCLGEAVSSGSGGEGGGATVAATAATGPADGDAEICPACARADCAVAASTCESDVVCARAIGVACVGSDWAGADSDCAISAWAPERASDSASVSGGACVGVPPEITESAWGAPQNGQCLTTPKSDCAQFAQTYGVPLPRLSSFIRFGRTKEDRPTTSLCGSRDWGSAARYRWNTTWQRRRHCKLGELCER